MSKRPRLSANLRTVVSGPFPESEMPARHGVVLGAPVLSEVADVSHGRAESAAGIVVDAVATATMLSCLAWSQGAMLPLRLAALAWRQAAPPAASAPVDHPSR